MKLKGENEEQIAHATQIRDCNLEIVNQLKAFIKEGKAWPDHEKDDEAGKKTKKTYVEQALAGLELVASELKSTDAAFFLRHGDRHPMVNSELLRTIVANSKAKERPEVELAIEKLETASHYFFNDPTHGSWIYRTMVPKYEFKRIENA